MEPKSPSKLKLPIPGFTQLKRGLTISITVFIIVLLFMGVYLAFNPVKTQFLLERSYYTVVVDCGSTGTRVNVYEWERNDSNLPILVRSLPDNLTKSLPLWKKSCHYHCVQTEPGLHNFVDNVTGVRASLEPLLVWAEQWVPRECHRDTPVFVLATAGLRRLAVEEAKQVLSDVEDVVKGHSFMYRKSWIRVLSGKEEAYYGWFALNYKMGNLGNSTEEYSTSGLLDLGGSSLQVVVEVRGAMDDENVIRSKIGTIDRQILAYSLPAFGLNAAFDRTVVLLSKVQTELRHPCLSSNFVQNVTCFGCFIINATNQQNSVYKLPSTESVSVHLVGDPNWEQCKRLVSAAAMNYSGSDWSEQTIGANCEAKSSSHEGSNMLNLSEITRHSKRFHALSGFFVVHDKLNLSPRASLTDIWKKGEQLCSKPSRTSENQFCFRLPYVASLLKNALCLDNTEIVFGPADVSWTIGAALLEGEYLWLDIPKPHTTFTSHETTIKVLSSPAFLFALLLSLLFITYCSWNKLPIPGKKGSPPPLPPFFHPKHRPH